MESFDARHEDLNELFELTQGEVAWLNFQLHDVFKPTPIGERLEVENSRHLIVLKMLDFHDGEVAIL